MMQGRLGMGLQCAALPSCSPSTPSPTPSDTADIGVYRKCPVHPPPSSHPPVQPRPNLPVCVPEIRGSGAFLRALPSAGMPISAHTMYLLAGCWVLSGHRPTPGWHMPTCPAMWDPGST